MQKWEILIQNFANFYSCFRFIRLAIHVHVYAKCVWGVLASKQTRRSEEASLTSLMKSVAEKTQHFSTAAICLYVFIIIIILLNFPYYACQNQIKCDVLCCLKCRRLHSNKQQDTSGLVQNDTTRHESERNRTSVFLTNQTIFQLKQKFNFSTKTQLHLT